MMDIEKGIERARIGVARQVLKWQARISNGDDKRWGVQGLVKEKECQGLP